MEISAFLELVRLVVDGDLAEVSRRLHATPNLATIASPIGATRQQATDFFFPAISHYLYAGDTALHMAAAAHSRSMAELLVSYGADCRARNRRGAEPLHYASDGNRSDPRSQASLIEFLISSGADPNAMDNSGVAPLHRAVRTRSVAAVKALLDGGAELRQSNKSGSTPLHLAVQNTGASGSGSDLAHQRQAAIIKLLLVRGASATDTDSQGKSVKQAATSVWIRELLNKTKHGTYLS
jgi:ankyrin repeat protein